MPPERTNATSNISKGSGFTPQFHNHSYQHGTALDDARRRAKGKDRKVRCEAEAESWYRVWLTGADPGPMPSNSVHRSYLSHYYPEDFGNVRPGAGVPLPPSQRVTYWNNRDNTGGESHMPQDFNQVCRFCEKTYTEEDAFMLTECCGRPVGDACYKLKCEKEGNRCVLCQEPVFA